MTNNKLYSGWLEQLHPHNAAEENTPSQVLDIHINGGTNRNNEEPNDTEDILTASEEALADLTKKALDISSSRNTLLPKNWSHNRLPLPQHMRRGTQSQQQESHPNHSWSLESQPIMKNNEDLLNFSNATNTLYYFRVLRDLMYSGHLVYIRE